jgi:N-acetylglutamate synthase-like GNAT family acetyltransferase
VKVSNESDWREYHALRREILWEARGLSGYDQNHRDEYVSTNHPLLLKLDERSIGTTRLDDFGNGRGAVRLVTIAADMQRQGHGRVLCALIESYAARLGITTLLVNAAPEAIGWYEKMGWEHYSWDTGELTGIVSRCEQMRKVISPAATCHAG